MTEYEKMIAGQLYDASDPTLQRMLLHAKNLWFRYNQTPPNEPEERDRIIRALLGKVGKKVDIQAPFFCDYGCHIELGENVFMNYNCIILDVNYVRIGDNTMFGPNVQIYTATHPLDAAERIKGPEAGLPITIGKNVWIGGGAIICPGVTIGDNTTIGAGAVVTKDIPNNVFAGGNPCKVIREI